MRTDWLLLGAIGLLAVVEACSGASGGDGPGAGGSSQSGGAGGGGGLELGGGGSSGSGAGINVGGGTSGGGGNVGDAACAETNATADNPVPLPADIIWAVDQSGSMNQETAYVQAKINDFANLIAATNIDYHVVMIASTTSGNSICVPPPLSGGSCGDGPRFRLVDQHVDSNNALDLVISEYPQYQDFLRPNAVKHFVVVTDDNATDSPINSAAAFTNALAGLQPAGMFQKWYFHSIYAYGAIPFVGCIGFNGTGAAYGTVYEALVAQTGGAQGVICVDDWIPVFTAISSAVVQGSKISCNYPVPDPGGGQTLDPNKVNVDYLPGGSPPEQPIYRVDTVTDCATGNSGGWYFDDNANPTAIILCPQTCSAVQADPNAKINVKFGCESVFKPPA
jgi:hypothetical protein